MSRRNFPFDVIRVLISIIDTFCREQKGVVRLLRTSWWLGWLSHWYVVSILRVVTLNFTDTAIKCRGNYSSIQIVGTAYIMYLREERFWWNQVSSHYTIHLIHQQWSTDLLVLSTGCLYLITPYKQGHVSLIFFIDDIG